MRLARVLLEDTSAPSLAIVRDGALYDVAELEARWSTRFADEPLAGDWHARVVSLRGDGLHDLDARLASGDRPSVARVLPGAFSWCTPCDDARHTFFRLGEGGHVVGVARALSANGARLGAFRRSAKTVALDVVVVIGDDLARASAVEARAAMIGATLLIDGAGVDTESALGPSLVTLDEVGRAGSRRAAIVRLGQEIAFEGAIDLDLDDAAARIAQVSHEVPLRAGDLFALHVASTTVALAQGALVDVAAAGFARLVAFF